MTAARFLDRLRAGPPILADGGTGTEKQRTGRGAEEVHAAFVAAGAELVVADTLTCVREPDGLARIAPAIEAARTGAPRWVAVSVGPLLRDRGPHAPAGCGPLVAEAARAGADVVFAETLLSVVDAEAILDAGRRAGLPVVVTFAFDASGRGYGGMSLDEVAAWVHRARPDAAGFNCGEDPGSVLRAGRELAARLPEVLLSLRPAAGAPGRPPASPEEMGAFGRAASALGARVVGGCCGVTPAHLAAVAASLRV